MDELCTSAGFAIELLSQADAFVDGSVVEAAWLAAIRLTGDDDLGLHLGESVQPASLGLLGFAMLSCSTIGEAVARMARYWSLMSDATKVHWRRNGRRATLELEVLPLPGNFLLHMRHPAESSLCAAQSLLRSLAAKELPLLGATSIYPAPARTAEYIRVLKILPDFGAATNSLVFDDAVMDWPVVYSDPPLLAKFETEIQQRLYASSGTLVDRLRRELLGAMRGDLPGLGSTARSLGVSPRALQRELQLMGTTFRAILDDLRRDLALAYLAERKYAIADIAFLLGFAEPSVFHRSFKKWTGLTPSDWRKSGATSPPTGNTTQTR